MATKKKKGTKFDFGNSKVSCYPRADGRVTIRWVEDGASRNTTALNLAAAEVKARRIAKRLVEHETQVVASAHDIELLERLRALANGRPLHAYLDELEDVQRDLDGKVSIRQVVAHYKDAGMLAKKRVLFIEARRRFLDQYKMGTETYQAFKKPLDAFDKRYPAVVVADITVEMIERACGAKKQGKASAKTFNNRLGYFKTFLNRCRDWGMLPAGKHAAEQVRRQKEGVSIPPVFSPETALKGLNALPDYLRPTFIIGNWMGPRPQAELRSIEWEHFDWERGYLEITMEVAGKTSRHRFTPIPENVKKLLAPWRDGGASGKVSGKAHVGAISALLKSKGIIGSWPQDIMRHSYISYMIALGRGIGQIAEWAGTSEKKIQKNYRRPLRREDGEKWFAVGMGKVG